jgi:hypothetical protein
MQLRNLAKASEHHLRISMVELELELLKNDLDYALKIKTERFPEENEVKNEPIFCEPLYDVYISKEKSFVRKSKKEFRPKKYQNFNCDVRI